MRRISKRKAIRVINLLSLPSVLELQSDPKTLYGKRLATRHPAMDPPAAGGFGAERFSGQIVLETLLHQIGAYIRK